MTDDGSRMTSSQVRKFLCLSAIDRHLLVGAALLLGAIRLGLWLLPFQTIRQLLAKMTQHASDARRACAPKRCSAQARDYPERIVWAVVAASRYVPKATCLTQALGAQVLLALRGYPAHLHFGVTKKGEEGQFEAHAWVEIQGKVLIGGSELGRYTPLSALKRQSL